MNLQQMEYIVALDKHRHFQLAADVCGVSQPTLSAMIQKLEDELDVKLFNRNWKNITPTDIGRKIVRQATVVLNEAKRIREVVADEADSMSGSLCLGVLPTIAPYLVPDFIRRFRETYPMVGLHIEEKEVKSLMHDLRFGNLDAIISTAPENIEGLLEIPVYTEQFVAYFSPQCDKVRECIAQGNLPSEHIWILKEGHCLPGGLMNLCQNREEGNRVYEAGSIETLVRIVDRNGGYTIIPELHIDMLTETQKQHIQYLQTTPPAQREVSILIKEDFIRERLINGVLQTLKAIIPAHMVEKRHTQHQIKLRS